MQLHMALLESLESFDHDSIWSWCRPTVQPHAPRVFNRQMYEPGGRYCPASACDNSFMAFGERVWDLVLVEGVSFGVGFRNFASTSCLLKPHPPKTIDRINQDSTFDNSLYYIG